MIALVTLLLVVCIALPLFFAWRLWRLDEPTRLGWIVVLAETVLFVALIMLLGRWDIAGMWTRSALIGLMVVTALISLRRHIGHPWVEAGDALFWRRRAVALASLAVYGSALAYVLIGGVFNRNDPRAMTFPLKDGWFVVAQGGGVGLLNYHSKHRAQRYALDITAVNAAGFHSSGLLPDDPARYVIFGKPVISPCTGIVVAAVDGLPDLSPPTPDPDRNNAAGNHVVLACDGLQVELAHLHRGSVMLKAGEPVRAGQPLGQVGNSGNTTEPHLHIQAVDPRTGTGVQMSFEGIVPIRNTAFRR